MSNKQYEDWFRGSIASTWAQTLGKKARPAHPDSMKYGSGPVVDGSNPLAAMLLGGILGHASGGDSHDSTSSDGGSSDPCGDCCSDCPDCSGTD